uniref:G-protein coupled receptors family 1 profile domain-containing protein n=1 Tax=Plectus sambesii TaxID=2011161 RepID=A0A914W1R6_9BILA
MNNSSDDNVTSEYTLEHLTSDYIEIVATILITAVGLPINLYVGCKLWRTYSRYTATHQPRELKMVMVTLKLHLTLANLLVLLLYCPWKVVWLITYQWKIGGDLGCRLLQFCWLFAFCISSNIVVCIAVDRARIVWKLCNIAKDAKALTTIASSSQKFVRRLLVGAWTLAFLCSVPQVVVWRHVTLAGWEQCATVWAINRALIEQRMISENDPSLASWTLSTRWANAYQVFHVCTVFWLPFSIVLISYVFILSNLVRFACVPYTDLRMSLSTSQYSRPFDDCTQAAEERGEEKCHPQLRPVPSEVMLRPNVVVVTKRRTSRLPVWRTQMRSRVFRTTALVVICYSLCWLPYNVISLARLLDEGVAQLLSENFEWLKVVILLSAVLNPFIYGFRE